MCLQGNVCLSAQLLQVSKVRKDYLGSGELSVTRGIQVEARWPPQGKLDREFQPLTQLMGKSLFNPEFLRSCVCPERVHVCVCTRARVCTCTHWHSPSTLNRYTHTRPAGLGTSVRPQI